MQMISLEHSRLNNGHGLKNTVATSKNNVLVLLEDAFQLFEFANPQKKKYKPFDTQLFRSLPKHSSTSKDIFISKVPQHHNTKNNTNTNDVFKRRDIN